MMRLEEQNRQREAQGRKPLKLPREWVERPQLHPVEQKVFNDFISYAAFCGGEVDPTNALSWFEINGVPTQERRWLGQIYSMLAPVLREQEPTSKKK
jgi:hypothetical protein